MPLSSHRARLEASFSQISVMAPLAGRAAAATAGACHNFTINWASILLTQPKYSTPASRMSALSALAGAGDVMLQKAFINFWTEMQSSGATTSIQLQRADELGYLSRGLKSKMVLNYDQFDENRLVDKVIKSRPRPIDAGVAFVYSFVFNGSVVGAGGGAHTIGFFRKCAYNDKDSAGVVLAFDPNFGEYYMFPDELKEWFTSLRSAYAPLTADFMKEANVK
jgi:hypothetical protein